MGLTLEYLTGWAAICALLLVITPTQAQQQLQELDQGDGKNLKPMYSFDVGPLTVDAFVNETEYKEKLRLRKAYMKYVISSKEMGGNMLPLSTMKMSIMEELVRCENLTLQNSDILAHIECMPLDYFVTDGTARGSGGGGNKLYTRRRSMRYKQKSMWSKGSGKSNSGQMAYGYDLKDEYVNSMLSGELKSLQLADSAHMFSASTIDRVGSYMEFQNGEIICSGSLLAAHDESKFSAPPKGLGMDDMAEYFQVLYKHGAFISTPDFTCRKENDLLGFALSTPITLVWQPEQFPYLTVKHEIFTSPLKQFWKYSGSITQQRAESSELGAGSKPQAYNTTIKIDSSSIFTPLFFTLEQTFSHTSEHEGWEVMVLTNPNFSAIIQSQWSMDTLLKSLRLLWPTEDSRDAKKWPRIELDFVDLPSKSDDILLTFKMSRKLWTNWMASEEQAQQDNSATSVHEEL